MPDFPPPTFDPQNPGDFDPPALAPGDPGGFAQSLPPRILLIDPPGANNSLRIATTNPAHVGVLLDAFLAPSASISALMSMNSLGVTFGNEVNMEIDVDGEIVVLSANGETHNGMPVWTYGGVPYASWNSGGFPRGFLRAVGGGYQWQVWNSLEMGVAESGPGFGPLPTDFPDVTNSGDFTAQPPTAAQVLAAITAAAIPGISATPGPGSDGTSFVAAAGPINFPPNPPADPGKF
jgi:hypothetical protein